MLYNWESTAALAAVRDEQTADPLTLAGEGLWVCLLSSGSCAAALGDAPGSLPALPPKPVEAGGLLLSRAPLVLTPAGECHLLCLQLTGAAPAQLLAGETLPYLSSDVTPAPNWLQEYNLVKDQVDAELQPFYSYSLENEFAAAAVRGARRIVDGRRGERALLGRGAGGRADDGRTEDVPSGRHHVHGHRALARQHGSARPGQLQRAGRREGRL